MGILFTGHCGGVTGMWEFLIAISVLFFIGGFLVLRDRGITFRRWLFIAVLAGLFIMMAVYGAEFLFALYFPSGPEFQYEIYQEQAFIQGLTLLGFGIVGFILFSVFQKRETEELAVSFGLAGAILIISGLAEMLRFEEAAAKFAVSLAGVIIVTLLIYRYRDFLMGDH